MTNLSLALAEIILHRFPDPDTIPYRRWCYVQGFVLCGFEKLWSYTGEPRYFDYIKTFVDQHVTPEGAIRDFAGDSLDDIMAGTTIVAVYEQTGEQKYRRAAETIRAAFEDYPRNSDGGFWHARRLPSEMWIDGVFMGQMFLSGTLSAHLVCIAAPLFKQSLRANIRISGAGAPRKEQHV